MVYLLKEDSKKMNKKIKLLCMPLVVITILSLVITFFLFGCKGDTVTDTTVAETTAAETTEAETTATETTAAEAEEPVNLQIWQTGWWQGVYNSREEGADWDSFFKFVAQEYMKENPNVNIDVQIVTGAERTEKLNANIAAGTPPDMFFDSSFVLTDFAHQGALIPLDDIISGEDREDISEASLAAFTIGDKLWGCPFTASTGYLVINTDMFEEAGAFIPEGEVGSWETPEQLEESLKAVSKLEGIDPLTLYCGSDQGDTINLMWLRMFGGQFFSDDGTEVVINNPEGVKALEFLLKMRDEGLANEGIETATVSDALGLFMNKQAASCFFTVDNERELITGLADGTYESPFNYKMTNFPSVPQPINFMYVGGVIAFDTKDEARIAATKDFIKFFSSREPYVFASGNCLPVRKSVSEKTAEIDYVDWLSSTAAYVDSMKYTIDFTGGVPGYLQLRSLLFPELQAAFTGAKTAQEALDSYAMKANEILAGNVEASVILK